MKRDFAVVYESSEGIPVRLEVAPRVDAAGNAYEHHRLVVADGLPGAVVVAVRDSKLLLAKSRRDAAGLTMWEFPRGVGEYADHGSLGTGLREFKEETGMRPLDARLIGTYVLDSSIYPQDVGVVACVVGEGVGGPTDGEVEEAAWFTTTQVEEMIRSGVVSDAHSLAAWAIWTTAAK